MSEANVPKCDAQKPNCQRCLKSGRECEGYEKYPVFVVRTQDGYQKRARLAEAKPHLRVSSPQPSSTYHSQLVGLLWTSMCPRDAKYRNEVGLNWLRQALDLASPTEALQLALQSLTLTRVGWFNRDKNLAMQGRQIYGEALRSLQNALYDPKLRLDEQTLVAARTMILYEFFESTSNNPASWKKHLNGVAILVKSRGSENYTTEIARSALEDVRDSMVSSPTQF